MADARKAHVEMLVIGRWAIINPDGRPFDGNTYATRGSATYALTFFQLTTNPHRREIMCHEPLDAKDRRIEELKTQIALGMERPKAKATLREIADMAVSRAIGR